MTISTVLKLGSGSSGPGGGNPSITIGGITASAGNLVFIAIAKDNVAGANGTTSEITSISSSVGGNTWVSAGAFCNAEGAEGDGIYVDLWYSVLTNGLGVGATITVNKTTDVACCVEAFKASLTGTSISGATPVTLENDDTAPFGTMSISVPSFQHLFIRVIGVNVTGGAFTPTDGWSRIDTVLSDPVEFDAVKLCGEYIIAVSGSATSSPTSTSNGDAASILFGLREGVGYARTAGYAAVGAMTSAATKSAQKIGTALYAAVATMTSAAAKTIHRTTAMAGAAFISSLPTIQGNIFRSMAAGGTATMSSAAVVTSVIARTTAFSGVGTMASFPTVLGTTFGSTLMSGVGSLSTTGAVVFGKFGFLVVDVAGNMSSHALLISAEIVRHTRSLIMLEGTLRPASNLASWIDRVELYDSETGDGIDLEHSLESITLSVRDPYTDEIVLRGDLVDGSIYVINPGIIEWDFPPEIMEGLEPKHYEVGCRVKLAEETIQVMLGHVSVRRGL